MRLSFSVVAPVLLLLLSAPSLEAQWKTQSNILFEYQQVAPVPVVPSVRESVTIAADQPRPMIYSVVGGLGGAMAGLVGGAHLGYKIDRATPCPKGCEDPGLTGLIAGAVIGSALLVPVGTHLASGRLDVLPRSLPITGAIGALSYLAGGTSVLLAPIVEIVVAIAIEQASER